MGKGEDRPDGIWRGCAEVDAGGEGEEGAGLGVGAVQRPVEGPELEGRDEGPAGGGVEELDGDDGGLCQHDDLPCDDGGPAGGAEVEVELREGVVAVESGVEEGGADEVARAGGDGERVAVLGAVGREGAEASRRRRGGVEAAGQRCRERRGEGDRGRGRGRERG